MGEIRRRVVDEHSELKLSMICEPDEEKLKGDQCFSVVRNSKKVIESDVKTVFICTPNQMIPELSIECLKRGKHVFCEKPPGRTLDDIVRIQEAERQNPGTKLMFGFNHRFHPGVMRAKSIVNSSNQFLRKKYGKKCEKTNT